MLFYIISASHSQNSVLFIKWSGIPKFQSFPAFRGTCFLYNHLEIFTTTPALICLLTYGKMTNIFTILIAFLLSHISATCFTTMEVHNMLIAVFSIVYWSCTFPDKGSWNLRGSKPRFPIHISIQPNQNGTCYSVSNGYDCGGHD